ncbi:MAG: ferritin-like domain-containing protein, partial [Myxococcota bacterium]
MIRSTAAKLLSSRGRRRARDQARGIAVDDLPFEMFDAARTAAEAASAAKLERIYHKGQDLAWNGKEVLPALIARHGGIHLDPATRAALQGLFAVILWGELAAWKISSDLAVRLEPLEAKLAATAQAHDEARHFYVMHDYLTALGPVPRGLGPHTTRVLSDTLRANTLAKKLVGMQ